MKSNLLSGFEFWHLAVFRPPGLLFKLKSKYVKIKWFLKLGISRQVASYHCRRYCGPSIRSHCASGPKGFLALKTGKGEAVA